MACVRTSGFAGFDGQQWVVSRRPQSMKTAAGTALLGKPGRAETALATDAKGLVASFLREGFQEGGEAFSQQLGQGMAKGNLDLGQSLK